ncbi:MAG: cytochrome b/b6 domain-containing protein [Rhodospirillaceae bacterium]|nr:cytochrome b/b6 domain-containing protein [Rhodospirillaceae bacterium]
MRKVWSGAVRVLHWSLVASVVAAWLTRKGFADDRHIWIGYGCVAVITLRMVWGFWGPQRDRFRSFLASPAATLEYARKVPRHAEPRYMGHNPLGAWMIVSLLLTIAVVCATGWLYTTDKYWGVDWVIQLHDAATTLLLCLVVLHLSGVVFTSLRHGENLVAAMLHGKKRKAGPGDIPP